MRLESYAMEGLFCKSFSDNLIFLRRSTQVGTFASAAGGRASEQKGVAAVAEREQIAFAKCDAVTATGSKRRDSKTNRPRHSLFPQTLAAPGFYGF